MARELGILEPAALYLLANAAYRTGDVELSEQSIDEHLKLSPSSAAGHFLQGQILFTNGRFTEALSALQTARTSDPANKAYHLGVYRALLALGRATEASDALLQIPQTVRSTLDETDMMWISWFSGTNGMDEPGSKRLKGGPP